MSNTPLGHNPPRPDGDGFGSSPSVAKHKAMANLRQELENEAKRLNADPNFPGEAWVEEGWRGPQISMRLKKKDR